MKLPKLDPMPSQPQDSPMTPRVSTALRPFPVVVHPVVWQTPHSCADERGNTASHNALVYIGGLTGGPHTAVELVSTLLTTLDEAALGFSVWEFRMRSSYTGWGYSTLDNDAQDIAALVTYLRKLGKRSIVLMGSSTGCQDCMRYMEEDPAVDAYILQGPTSDRLTAAMLMTPEAYQRSLDYTRDQIVRGNISSIVPKYLLPDFITSPIAVHRWYSLVAKGGNEDYFSPDLDDGTMVYNFRVMNRPILILPSECDEMVPDDIDKEDLHQRWIQASPPRRLVSQLSAVVPEADHTLSTVASQRWFADQVVEFLRSLDGVHAE